MSDLIGKQVNNILRREKRVINKIYTCDMPWVERRGQDLRCGGTYNAGAGWVRPGAGWYDAGSTCAGAGAG